MDDKQPLSDVKGVGPSKQELFLRLGLKTVGDLIYFYPRRYEDYSFITKVKDLKPGPASIEVKIKSVSSRYLAKGRNLTEAIAADETGPVRLVWFNQPYRSRSINKDATYFVSGTYELKYRRFGMINPSMELKSDMPVNAARILPKYSETKGLTSKDIRKIVSQLAGYIASYHETLPADLVKQFKLMPLSEALSEIHFPTDAKTLNRAINRLGFEELFHLTLSSLLNKKSMALLPAKKIKFDEQLASSFTSNLKFHLTDDQRRTVWQIYKDMESDHPMNRLVEGDVGSGKTVVAAMASLMAIHANRQTAFMAPTELLARQHAETIYELFNPLNLEQTVLLITGQMTNKQKQQAYSKIQNNECLMIVGTHSLIQEKIDFSSLSLVIIDEQHRFGVKQRQTLYAKSKDQPHLLTLSATPIPRSLALTLFGELSISRLIDKPTTKRQVKTIVMKQAAYLRQTGHFKDLLDKKQQMFVVCPAIEEGNEANLNSLETVYKQIKRSYPDHKVSFVHGKMKAEDKQAVVQAFRDHEIDILVSTTVIEVGINVPNASIMVIMSSDNFGLAQLHQLRGRVGRAGQEAECWLIVDDTRPISKRLRALETIDDGFKLAEIDLRLRGPGQIYGHLQHGSPLDLRLADLEDAELIKRARQAAEYFVDNGYDLEQFKQLSKSVTRLRRLTNLS